MKGIAALMAGSRYGIHDLSRTQLDSKSLPRFNMPFELGIDWALKHFGDSQQQQKRLLLLECVKYRTQKCLSDIAGQDPFAHKNSTKPLIGAVRTFLMVGSQRKNLPGDVDIAKQFKAFSKALPNICASAGLDRTKVHFVDYVQFCKNWLVGRATTE